VLSDEPRHGPSDIKSLRSRAHVLAWQLVRRHGLEDCLSATPYMGMGFVVDLPQRPLLPSEDHATGSLRWWVWCYLFAMADQINSLRSVQNLPVDSRLRALALGMTDEGRQIEEIKQAIFVRAAAIAGHWMQCDVHWQFLTYPFAVGDRDFRDVLLLAQACRDLRKQSGNDNGDSLWEKKP
jgi:hypothetical protein